MISKYHTSSFTWFVFCISAAKDLIERLLIVDKKKRYNAIDVLCHPWIITQGGALAAPENMEQHRKNLRKDLEIQAKYNLESFQNRLITW